MSRAPDQPRLSRQQRRRLERELPKLLKTNACSFCGRPFPHASPTVGGFDARGNVVLTGECCVHQVAQIFTVGLALNCEQIAAAYQKAEADRILDNAERYGGFGRLPGVNFTDSLWKDDDRAWFQRNQSRAHRMRPPFPGEVDEEAAKTPPGHALIMLVRQIEPGARQRVPFYLDTALLPLPDDDLLSWCEDEAVAHALFEVAVEREAVPPDQHALDALIQKYSVHKEPGQ
jgi:hypothetical protein